MTTTLEKVSASVPDTQLPVQLLVLGVAMPIKHLGEHANWLLEPQQHGHGGRDLELQDSCRSEVIDGFAPRQQVLPQLGNVACARKAARHADNGNALEGIVSV